MNRLSKIIIIALFTILAFIPVAFAGATTVEELSKKINSQRSKIQELEKDIARQRALLQQKSQEANSLQGVVNTLDASEREILRDIRETEAEIAAAELSVEKLNMEIDKQEQKISVNSNVLAQSIRELERLNSTSLIEILFGYDNFSDFWDSAYQIITFQKEVKNKTDLLRQLNEQLREQELAKLDEKDSLVEFTSELETEKKAVAYTKQEKAELLSATRNQEDEYQRILNQKIAERKAFEAALFEFESQLQTIINPENYPAAKNGILSWPLDSVIITQQFGGTQFAKQNPHIYGRAFHSGTDFGAPIGTPIKAVMSGTVTATGNTDAVSGCSSWGKWTLIKHPNGLSTLYAHQSVINVSEGQAVTTGQTIGLIGNTGFSTGPHLHLTLYATQGVEVRRFEEFKTQTGCAGATTPTAPTDAYLDPMKYLPTL